MADIEYQFSLSDDLFRKRILIMDKELNEATCAELIGRLILLDLSSKTAKKPIVLLINSYGGDTSAALGVADIIKTLHSPVYTACIGIAQSGGSILLAAGHKRFALENADIMIHQHWKEFDESVNHAKLMNEAKVSKLYYQRIMQYYLDNTHGKISKKKLNELLKVDSYMTAEEAINYGLIDEIGFKLSEWLK